MALDLTLDLKIGTLFSASNHWRPASVKIQLVLGFGNVSLLLLADGAEAAKGSSPCLLRERGTTPEVLRSPDKFTIDAIEAPDPDTAFEGLGRLENVDVGVGIWRNISDTNAVPMVGTKALLLSSVVAEAKGVGKVSNKGRPVIGIGG